MIFQAMFDCQSVSSCSLMLVDVSWCECSCGFRWLVLILQFSKTKNFPMSQTILTYIDHIECLVPLKPTISIGEISPLHNGLTRRRPRRPQCGGQVEPSRSVPANVVLEGDRDPDPLVPKENWWLILVYGISMSMSMYTFTMVYKVSGYLCV